MFAAKLETISFFRRGPPFFAEIFPEDVLAVTVSRRGAAKLPFAINSAPIWGIEKFSQRNSVPRSPALARRYYRYRL
jgi:hypothetical protein